MALSNLEKQRRYNLRHPGRSAAAWKRYQYTPKGTVTCLLNYARDRARRYGYPFSISRDDVERMLAPGICEVSGLPIERIAPGGRRIHPFAPSLDRIVPELGYVPGNVRLVCFAVNRARSDFGDEIMVRVARAIAHRNPEA